MGIVQRIFGLEKRASLPNMPTSGGVFASSNILNWIFGTANSSGQTVNQITSLKLSSFYASVRNISEDIAKLPFYVYSVDSEFNKKLVNHPASYLLNKQPSTVSIPFTFKQTLLEFALIQGNGYAYIERDKNAKPIALYVLDSRYVTPQIYNQKLYYIIQDINSGVKGTFTQDEIFHIKGMGDGYVGQSIVGYAAESIGKALATQSYASGFFGNGATLTGTIEVPGVVENEATANNIKTRFIDSIKGNGTASGVGLLANGAKFTKISVSPNEAQFIESQEFNVADIARWFRMPLSKIQSGSTGSSNLEQLNIEYVTDCLMPWLVRFEQEVERKLFRVDEMNSLDAKFDVSKLLRGDMASTATYLKDLYYIGAINVNDARRFLDMNNIGADGDIYFSPLNMIPTNMSKEYWATKDGAANQTSLKGANPKGN
jgi:HK97 family phage portal protein